MQERQQHELALQYPDATVRTMMHIVKDGTVKIVCTAEVAAQTHSVRQLNRAQQEELLAQMVRHMHVMEVLKKVSEIHPPQMG